jgi:hypothetical protein
MSIFSPGPLFGACEEKLDLEIYRLLWPVLFLLLRGETIFQSIVQMIPPLREA